MKRLTQQESEALPEGTKVQVTWSGGNGPHWYRIRVDKRGNRQISSGDTLRPSIDVESVAGAMIGLEKPSTILEVEDWSVSMECGVYEHYKGGRYLLIGIAQHTETDELFVVYVSLTGAHLPGPRLRVRPLSLFTDQVDGKPRFKFIGQDASV